MNKKKSAFNFLADSAARELVDCCLALYIIQINFKLIFFCPPIKDKGFLTLDPCCFLTKKQSTRVGLDSDL